MATDVHVQRFQLPEGSKLQRLTEDLPAVPFGTNQYAKLPRTRSVKLIRPRVCMSTALSLTNYVKPAQHTSAPVLSNDLQLQKLGWNLAVQSATELGSKHTQL